MLILGIDNGLTVTKAVIFDATGRVLATARQIAMYLCREMTDLSLPKIGAKFGGRDHSTVIHAVRKISEKIGVDRALYTQVTELTNQIKQS